VGGRERRRKGERSEERLGIIPLREGRAFARAGYRGLLLALKQTAAT